MFNILLGSHLTELVSFLAAQWWR